MTKNLSDFSQNKVLQNINKSRINEKSTTFMT